jgi:hypothetical protein
MSKYTDSLKFSFMASLDFNGPSELLNYIYVRVYEGDRERFLTFINNLMLAMNKCLMDKDNPNLVKSSMYLTESRKNLIKYLESLE